MDNAELGRRLKSARLARKMTQSDVVGSFITRNMLSQIESGTATPSMKTLEYLSEVLEIPLERLLSDSDSYDTEQKGFSLLQEVKQLIREQKYQEALEIEDPTGLLEDEMHALRSIAWLELAKSLADSGQTEALQTAVIHAKNAAQEAESGIYANSDRIAQAHQLIAKIAKHLSNYYSSLALETAE